MKKDNQVALLNDFAMEVKHMIVKIEGDGDLILNKMNERNKRFLTSEDRKNFKEVPNVWEDIITAIHWKTPLSLKDTKKECTEEMLYRLLHENAPCLTAFGLKKSWRETVSKNEFANDKYGAKFFAAVNIFADGGLCPIKFDGYQCEEALMSPKRGSPITVHLSHFSKWSADIHVTYLEHVYNRDQILNVINLAGFCIGIGSGRTSGFGRYHIAEVAA